MSKEDSEPKFRATEHVYVPKHEILDEEEKKKVLQKFSVKPEQFPYIRSIDPVVKEIGAKPGDLLKITRRSEAAGEAIYYRYVVEG
ncbi:MAG: DNA-directed RNA polymerase subunit H [Nitrososphaerales archaeon]